MANTLPNFSFFCILTISIFLSSVLYQTTADGLADELSVKRIKNKPMKQKISTFTVYWRDQVSGPNPTAMQIIKPVSNQTSFGMVRMIDNALTLGPDSTSKEVGRAQGLYGIDSLDMNRFSAIMMMNFVFRIGKYNGSSITIMGNNNILNKVREMHVVGGSGLFRFARGYVQLQTHMFDMTTGNAIVKYDVYVMHY